MYNHAVCELQHITIKPLKNQGGLSWQQHLLWPFMSCLCLDHCVLFHRPNPAKDWPVSDGWLGKAVKT